MEEVNNFKCLEVMISVDKGVWGKLYGRVVGKKVMEKYKVNDMRELIPTVVYSAVKIEVFKEY